MTSSGVVHETATVLATEPSSRLLRPVRPCEPITIRSARSAATMDASTFATVPTAYRAVASTPARRSAFSAGFKALAASVSCHDATTSLPRARAARDGAGYWTLTSSTSVGCFSSVLRDVTKATAASLYALPSTGIRMCIGPPRSQ